MHEIPILSQTLVEYGALTAALAGIQQRIEGYLGAGNLKYLLIAVVGVIILLWVRQRMR
jgi:hypothetical protein